MYGLEGVIRSIYRELERLGYKPVIIGTYALILQGWLPSGYLEETKDIDVYIDEPMVVFDDRIEERMLALGLSIGRSESGGFYVDAGKPVEIVYPIHDFFIPRVLLEHTVVVGELRVLEGHATLVAKALGSSIEHLAPIIKAMSAEVKPQRLFGLLECIVGEVEPSRYEVAKRRIDAFIKRYLTNKER
ncbi:MAG: hypothetical protein F7C38_05070 [Desulfurococcales archaeon]|nr:hypothetical protein [Desulfurococcales archaeon]